MSNQTENQSPFLTYDQLSAQQKNEVQIQIKKIAMAEGIGIKEVLDQVKRMYFCEIAGHLHFADFHPISMLDI